MDGVVASELVGAAWPAVQPGSDPVLYGHVSLDPVGAFEARSLQTFRLVYTVGRYGIDDTGSIRVVFRFMGDWGAFQTNNPSGYNYVTADASTGARLSLNYANTGHQRPWFKSLTVSLHGGYLSEGDTITIVFGDTSQGSPGMKMQTFCERGFEFKVLADVCAVGHYYPLPKTPHIAIVPGEVHEWKAVLPSLRRLGEAFRLGIKAEDKWGNPTDQASGRFTLRSSHPVKGLPEKLDYPLGEKSVILDNLCVEEPGVVRIQVLDESGDCVAEAGPLLIRDGEFSGYWGDLHGQSGESIGLTTSRDYFEFARNKSFLDVTGHQANDFQVNNAFWKYLNELTAEFHEDGRFVVFPGYEWSGNTAVGGDRNVFFRTEGRQIRRSSHALLEDRSDLDTDASSAAQLFEDLQGEDCVVYAHVGGRYADIMQAHDPRLETAMEIHSAWGTFEWMLTDGFPLGHRSGVVCNSDGHKGRPGASYPGASTFGAYGGLTCFLTKDLTRDGIFECLRRRHHYGTTGCRMHMEVAVQFDEDATVFERDPNAFPDTKRSASREVMMGDIVQSSASEATLKLNVLAHSPIERIEIRNGTEVLETFRPYAATDLGNRIRVIWSGAEYRGRGRQSTWTGRAVFKGCRIERLAKINAWNHERRLERCSRDTVEWDAITTGNFGGFDVWLEEGAKVELDLTTNRGTIRKPLETIGLEDTVLEAGGLERRLRVFRLPEENPHREVEHQLRISLKPEGDNPLWICVTTEDGFQAWSSPVFVYRKPFEAL
ncbi:MAG TPA: DUF3604 domain-containing protein [Candidatus Lambdaproteobacteria bacterium]|nr:DUF3604 domain-containing protein [Candidatus Lambdaproteobacteria bacterium]